MKGVNMQQSGREKSAKFNEVKTGRCDSCEFYDYDEEWEEYLCTLSLDEDEMIRFLSGDTGRCPYYRYYDEYKSVHKQI